MAVIDYGAVVFKNYECLNPAQLFTSMKDMVGWEDDDTYTYRNSNNEIESIKLKDEYYAYAGDKDVTVGFFKESICICGKYKHPTRGGETHYVIYEALNLSNYKWKSWHWQSAKAGKMQISHRFGHLVFKWKYKGEYWKVHFGYGVRYKWYMKYL